MSRVRNSHITGRSTQRPSAFRCSTGMTSAGAAFDVINLEQVLEHLVDPIEVLTHLGRSLEKDGVLRVSVPDGRKMAARLAGLESSMSVEPGYLMPVQPLDHLNCFSYTSLVAIGESAELRLVRPSLRKLFDSVSGWCSLKGAARNAAGIPACFSQEHDRVLHAGLTICESSTSRAYKCLRHGNAVIADQKTARPVSPATVLWRQTPPPWSMVDVVPNFQFALASTCCQLRLACPMRFLKPAKCPGLRPNRILPSGIIFPGYPGQPRRFARRGRHPCGPQPELLLLRPRPHQRFEPEQSQFRNLCHRVSNFRAVIQPHPLPD